MKYNFVTVDTLLAKFARELKDTTINEGDVVEWIGEALSFMKSPTQNEEAVALVEVSNYTAVLPTPMKYLIQVAKVNHMELEHKDPCKKNYCPTLEELYNSIMDIEEPTDTGSLPDCKHEFSEGNTFIIPGTYTRKYDYLNYLSTYYRKSNLLTPMKLANNKFFNTLVCKEIDNGIAEQYRDCDVQYSIIGDSGLNALRTSFREGYILVAYVRTPVDDETGYPMIPDEANHLQAINYYVRWKIAEALAWVGREGYDRLALQSEERWLKYIRQANNTAKMPTTRDDYEDLKNQSLYLIPRTNKYSSYFGTLTKEERLRF